MLTTTSPKKEPKLSHRLNPVSDLPYPLSSETREVSPAVKIAIIGGFLLSLIAFTTAALLSRSLVSEKRAHSRAEASRIQLEDQIDVLQQENSDLRSQTVRLREQIKTHSIESSKVSKDLDQTSIELSNSRKQIRTLEQQNVELKKQIASLQKEIQEANNRTFAASPTAFAGNAVVPAAAEKRNEETIASQPEFSATSVASAGTENGAQIMTVNRKFNFAVINLGLTDNLKMGDRLSVMRDGQVIGTLQVEKLYDRFAAATILNKNDKLEIEKGDNIRVLSA